MEVDKHTEGTKLLAKIAELKKTLGKIKCLLTYSKCENYPFEISCDMYSADIPTSMTEDILLEMKEKYEAELSSAEKKFKKL